MYWPKKVRPKNLMIGGQYFYGNINNPTQICKWVNDFNIAGPDALRPKKDIGYT